MRRLASVLILFAAPLAAEELKLGKPIDTGSITSIHDLLANPEAFVGKTVRIEGTVGEVCPMMGCWMDLKDARTGDTLKVKVNDGEMVFPKEATGKRAMAQGTFVKQVLTREQLAASLKHEAEELGKKFDPSTVTQGKTIYRIQGQGAVIR
jgi:hypothetical protein